MERRSYTLEFKKQAIDLAESLGSVTKAAEQLGVSDLSIHTWKKKFKESEGQKLDLSSEQEEIRRLRQENAELKKVNHILKSAAAFFSQDHLK